VRLEVVGVLAPRSPLGDGVFLSDATAARAGLPSARQITYYLRTRDGLTPERAASALNVSFGDRGLRASVVDPELRLSQAVQAPLSFLLQGFMGLGLVSGVLAVGLLSARAVLERRAQIGMLRAVGMRAGAVQFSLLLEGSVVALAGAGVGLGVGAILAGQVVRFLQRAHPEFPLVVPVDQLAAIAVLAWGASLLAAAVPAWRAGRIAPVEALRYE
jgi:putative ABC transport system permease protein